LGVSITDIDPRGYSGGQTATEAKHVSDILFTTMPQRRRRRFRDRAGGRALRVLAIALICVGALALLDAAVTLVWQEPFSALYALVKQNSLSGSLSRIERATPTPLEREHLASLPDEQRRVAYLAAELQRHATAGSAVGRIVIPEVNADYVVVKGTGTSELESGPGVYPETSFPGISGTTAIAGHRTTWLAPFRDINLLKPGNHILLYMPYAHFTYTVTGQRVVSPSNVQAATAEVGYSRLVLSACTPLFSAAKRLLVYARLTRTLPVGAAREVPGGGAVQPIETPLASGRARGSHPKARSLERLPQAL
jgi:sortase A